MAGLYVEERDPRKWCALRRAVEAEMVSAGWIRRSAKFDEVARRRTRAAWRRL